MNKTSRLLIPLILLPVILIAAVGHPMAPAGDGGGFPTATPTNTPLPTATPTNTPETPIIPTATPTAIPQQAPIDIPNQQIAQPTAVPPPQVPESPSAASQLMPVIFVAAFGLLVTLVAAIFIRSNKKP